MLRSEKFVTDFNVNVTWTKNILVGIPKLQYFFPNSDFSTTIVDVTVSKDTILFDLLLSSFIYYYQTCRSVRGMSGFSTFCSKYL